MEGLKGEHRSDPHRRLLRHTYQEGPGFLFLLRTRWPALAGLEGAPAYNVGRAYAAFAADIDNATHTVPDFADAVQRHEFIAAIERSAVSGARVKV